MDGAPGEEVFGGAPRPTGRVGGGEAWALVCVWGCLCYLQGGHVKQQLEPPRSP